MVAFAVGLITISGFAAYSLVQACGLRLPFGGTIITICEPPELRAKRDEAVIVEQDNDALLRHIATLERDLAGLSCIAEKPPPPPPPPPKPKRPKTPSGLNPDAFKNGDISVMKGCWQLISVYKTRDIRTGKVTTYKNWRVCFDGNGNGRQTMKATNGVTCSGTIRGRISRNKLIMNESRNIQCSSGSFIYRRDVTCTLDAQGRAHCVGIQPEVGGRGNAVLRRAR